MHGCTALIPLGKAKAMAASGDQRHAVKLLERSFEEAKKEHDLRAPSPGS
jgi:Cdc6-like AAA superfamily ATPase